MTEAAPILRRVLLTNDDGITAPGLGVLERVAALLAREVWVVAPEHDQSGTSHAVSLHAPLRVSPQGGCRFAVAGTPGDCVALALHHLMRDAPPDMILSGINRGANLGVETVFSGTVGAAMTGLLLGVPSVALSQAFTDRDAVPWATAESLAPDVLRRLVGIEVVSGTDPCGLSFHWLQLRRGPRAAAPRRALAARAARAGPGTPLRFERTDEDSLADLRLLLG